MIRALILFSLIISIVTAKETIDERWGISVLFPETEDWTAVTKSEYSPKTQGWGARKKDGSIALSLMATNDDLPEKQQTFESDSKIWEQKTSHLITSVLSRRITSFKGHSACEIVALTVREGRTIYSSHWMIQGQGGYYYFITIVAADKNELQSSIAVSFLESIEVSKQEVPNGSQRPATSAHG